jgi:hypothetical protein
LCRGNGSLTFTTVFIGRATMVPEFSFIVIFMVTLVVFIWFGFCYGQITWKVLGYDLQEQVVVEVCEWL